MDIHNIDNTLNNAINNLEKDTKLSTINKDIIREFYKDLLAKDIGKHRVVNTRAEKSSSLRAKL